MGRVVPQWPGKPGFDPSLSHTNDSKIVLDTSLINTQHYKGRIKGKVEQSKERSRTLLYNSIEKKAFESLLTKVDYYGNTFAQLTEAVEYTDCISAEG